MAALGAVADAGAALSPEARGETADPADAELARLRDFLVGADRTFATRRDAADVLIEKHTPPALDILAQVLAGPTPSEPTLAVLTAIAGRDAASDVLIDPLFVLLRSEDEPTRRAAALALGAYQGNEKVLAGLKGLATSGTTPMPIRLAAIQALAQIVDKRAIETLVEITADPVGPAATAAADALAEMTGLDPRPEDAAAWAAWWTRLKDDPESKVLGGLLRRFREQLNIRNATLDRVQTRLLRCLTDLYEAADPKGRARLALEHMEDPVTAVRALGARQAGLLARVVLTAGNGTARQAHQEVIAALIKHVNDESPPARAAAAEALVAWQETAAGPVLLARLDKEKASDARAAIAFALGGLKVVEAVPRLVAMLDAGGEAEVIRAAGALGQIGDRNGPNGPIVEPGVAPLTRLARSAALPAVREAACLALAKIAPPTAEETLGAALEDPATTVRFAAAQGLGSLAKVSAKTIAALGARLQDDNKGVRQAVAAALAKLDGPEAAERMADRLKEGGETEPAVRNALWDAVRALADAAATPDLARDLGDRFFGRDGAESMQRAGALYEIALTKVAAAQRNSPAAIALYEKLVDAYVAAGMPDSAVPTLRQLLVITPADNAARLRQLNQQLGLILLAKEPYTESVTPLVAAMDGADAADRAAIVRAVQTRAETLLKAERPEPALDLIVAFAAARPDYGGTDATATLKALRSQAAAASITQAVAKLGGAPEQAAAAALTLKKIGATAADALFDTLEAAARAGNQPLEARAVAALEAVTGRSDHGYAPTAPLAERLKKLAAWRGGPATGGP
jgi:HEAT repeat protein